MKKLLLVIFLLVWGTENIHAQKIVKFEVTPFRDSVVMYEVPATPIMSKFKPPAIYKQWWREIEMCSHMAITSKQKNEVEFWYILGIGFLIEDVKFPQYTYALGVTYAEDRKIILAASEILNKTTVKHEMLHFILWEHGIGGHTSLFKKCDLVK